MFSFAVVSEMCYSYILSIYKNYFLDKTIPVKVVQNDNISIGLWRANSYIYWVK